MQSNLLNYQCTDRCLFLQQLMQLQMKPANTRPGLWVQQVEVSDHILCWWHRGTYKRISMHESSNILNHNCKRQGLGF